MAKQRTTHKTKILLRGDVVELDVLRAFAKKLKDDPKEAKAIAVKAGIYRKNGHLAKAFGG